jgi:Exocyst complex component Sec10
MLAFSGFLDPSDRILQKHIKRQIISLAGGFQVIADLNAYHSFISSLRVSCHRRPVFVGVTKG